MVNRWVTKRSRSWSFCNTHQPRNGRNCAGHEQTWQMMDRHMPNGSHSKNCMDNSTKNSSYIFEVVEKGNLPQPSICQPSCIQGFLDRMYRYSIGDCFNESGRSTSDHYLETSTKSVSIPFRVTIIVTYGLTQHGQLSSFQIRSNS